MLFVSLLFLLVMNSIAVSSSCPVESFLPHACDMRKETLESVRSFYGEITRRNTHLLEDPRFQEIASELKNQMPDLLTEEKYPLKSGGQLYVFASFSLGEEALLNIAQEAKNYGATLVLRGFKDGSLTKTAQALHKIILKTGQGVMIDSELFTLFNITAVPTFILAKPFLLRAFERNQTPLHDRLQGHISVRHVLESFVKEGDLKTEAKTLLERGAL